MESNNKFYQQYMADNYDRMSSTYDRSMDYKWKDNNDPRYVFDRAIINVVNDNCSKEYKALDVGTGTGRISIMLASKFPQISVTGLDQSKEMIEVASEKAKNNNLKNIKFDNYSVEGRLPYEDNTFDIVTCSLAMIYFTQKDSFINETRRIVKNGGNCIVSTIGVTDMESVLNPFWDLYHKYNPNFKNTFNPKLSEEQLKELFINAGYKNVDVNCFKEDVVFGSVEDYLALFNTYGLSGLLFFLPKSDAVNFMDEYKNILNSMCEEDGRLIVGREVLTAIGN